jgi:NADH-quinone oxidoreductase subunit M
MTGHIPGTSRISEILLGAFNSTFLGSVAYAAVSALGVIFAAVYLLWMYQRVMMGPVREGGTYGGHHLKDITLRESVSLALIVVFVVWIGVYPSTFMTKSAAFAKQTVQVMENVRTGSSREAPAVTEQVP